MESQVGSFNKIREEDILQNIGFHILQKLENKNISEKQNLKIKYKYTEDNKELARIVEEKIGIFHVFVIQNLFANEIEVMFNLEKKENINLIYPVKGQDSFKKSVSPMCS